MLTLTALGTHIASKRKHVGLSQTELAKRAAVSRVTIDALENGRSGELGFSKITRILSCLGMELKIHEEISQRPTLDELMKQEVSRR